MLAIFNKSVAVCPDHFMKPHHNSVSALDNGFLVNHFASLHPTDYVVKHIGASAVFAYSLQRFRFDSVDDTFCIYQGYMDDVASLRNKYDLNPEDDELHIVIQAFKILQEIGLQTPDHVISNLIGEFSFIVYDSTSELIILTSAKSGCFPMFWGIDSESSLILSDDLKIVEKACLSALQPFPPSGHVYISRRGLAGLEAILHDHTTEEAEQPPPETEATDVTSEIEPWQPPPPHVFKINTEGIAFPKEKMVGIGVIIRNSSGKVILAGSKKIKGFSSQIHAPGLAAVEGLTLAIQAGFRNVIWERVYWDSESSAYTRLIDSQLVLLFSHFSPIGFSSTQMNANKAAFGLAEYAMEVEDCIVWELETPECISSVVEMESHMDMVELEP